jgi:hypothetical protein
MEEVFQALIYRSQLNWNRLKTIFGAKTLPHHRHPQPESHPMGGRGHYGKSTLKIYTKGERVFRSEVIVHNTRNCAVATRGNTFRKP